MSLMDTSSDSSSTNSLSTVDSSASFADIKTKVDRKILDTMLNGGNQTLQSAEDFFVHVANESGAIITYPRKEKIGQFGRREPEIRLLGTPSQVQNARNSILEMMGPYKNRVTLKIDVSHLDHSHIIGKGGRRISGIMKATETHIHFPDCNRIESEAKSNLVTIAANTLTKAEEARTLIRKNSPLTISFNVDVNTRNADLLSPKHQNIEFIQKCYNVLITFKANESSVPNSRMVTVLVRGTRLQFDNLKEAIRSVYNHINGSVIGFNSLVSTIETEISVQNYHFVVGRGNNNIKSIYAHTGAIVTFPDFTGFPTANKDVSNTKVVIKGRGTDSAYMAWIELLGYLPLTMIFSLPPDYLINGNLLQSLMNEYDMTIMIRQKSDSSGKALILKIQEMNSHNLFEARSRILGLREELPALPQATTCSEPKFTPFGVSAFFPSSFYNYETECLRAFKPPFEF